MSNLIGKAYNPYGMASNGNGLISGYEYGRNLAKQRGLASGFSKVLAGDNSGWKEMAEADPQATMNAWNQREQLKRAERITPYQQAMLDLKKEEIDAMKDAGKYDSPYERTLQQEEAKNVAETQQKAKSLEASMPAFEEMAKQLNEVGKDSTYTLAGQGYDWVVRNLGLGATKGAEARERYKQIVNNELLPKLRETFGGQLSDAERENLLATLGNVDLTPKEREQAVKSFIESKKRQLEGYKRQLGGTSKEEKEETVIDWSEL